MMASTDLYFKMNVHGTQFINSPGELPDKDDMMNLGIIPTPPRSPSIERDISSYFTDADGFDVVPAFFTVNPNKVLNQPLYLPELSQNVLLDFGPDPSPSLDSEDDGTASDVDFDPLGLFNEIESEYLTSSLWDDFDHEINPLMKTGPISPVAATSSPMKGVSSPCITPTASVECCHNYFVRKRTDSACFFDSSLESTLFPQIIDLDRSVDQIIDSCSAGRPETPSESSDSDNDDKILRCRLGNIKLDHNYHTPSWSGSKRPTPSKVPATPQSASVIDTDDEVDVEFFEEIQSPFSAVSSDVKDPIDGYENLPDAGVSLTFTGVQRGRRKRGAPATRRKVGRPRKVKRLCVSPDTPPLIEANDKENIMVLNRWLGLGTGRNFGLDPKKRTLHNSLERMRRVDLKNWFDTLRDKVPALKEKPRAPKVLILTAAAEYCNSMSKIEGNLIDEKSQLNEYNLYLKRHLHLMVLNEDLE